MAKRRFEVILAGDAKSLSRAFDQGARSAEGFGGKVANVAAGAAKALAAVGLAAATALGAGALEAIDAQAIGDRLAGQLDLTKAQSEVAGRVAGSLYSDAYGDSLQEVTDAVGAVGSSLTDITAGNAEDLERLTTKALDLSSAFGLDVAQSAQLAGITIRHGLADDADEAFDLITRSMQRMPAHMRDELVPAVEEYGDELAAVGLVGADAFGLLVEASRDGMFGIDKTGDAIKEFTIRATDMSAASKAAYDRIGLSQHDMSNAILAGGDTARDAFGRIVAGLQDIKDPARQAEAAIALFGTPIEDLGVAEIPQFLDSLTNASATLGDVDGAAERLGSTINNNLRTRIESMKRTALMGLANVATRVVLPALDGIADWIEGARPQIEAIATAVGDWVSGALTDLGGWWDDNGPAIVGFVDDVADAIGGWIDDVAPAIESWVDDVLGELSDWWDTWGPRIVDLVEGIAEAVGTMAEGVVRSVQAVHRNWDQLRVPLAVIAGLITAVMIPHFAALGVASVINSAKVAAGWVTTQTSAIGAAVVHSAQVAKMVAGWVLVGAQSLLHAGKVAAAWLIAMGPIALVIAAVVGLVAIIVANWETITAAIGAGWDWVTTKTGQAWDWVTTKIDGVVAWFRGVPGQIRSAAGDLFGFVRTKATEAKDWVGDRIDDIVGFFTSMPRRLTDGAGDLFGFLTEQFRTAINALIGIWNDFEIPSLTVGGQDPLGPFGPSIPEVTIGGWSLPPIGYFARGGVVTDPTLAMIGEDPRTTPEIVTPQQAMEDSFRRVLAEDGRRGGLTIEHAIFGDRRVVGDLDWWARTRAAGV